MRGVAHELDLLVGCSGLAGSGPSDTIGWPSSCCASWFSCPSASARAGVSLPARPTQYFPVFAASAALALQTILRNAPVLLV